MQRRKAADDESAYDPELSKLQRQFRVTEGDRKTYSDTTQQALRKQQEQLAKLTKDNEFLNKELSLAEAAAGDMTSDQKQANKLSEMLNTHQEEVAAEKKRIEEMDKAIKALDKTIYNERKQLGGVSGIEENKAKMRAQIATMENRVEKTLKKYNQTLTGNSRLREKIDHLKQERKVFDTLQKKLEKELNTQKKQIAEVMEQSKQAYDARDEAQHKMAMLDEKASKEAQQHAIETKELSRELEHERKLKSFMGVKGAPRAVDELSLTHRQRGNNTETSEQAIQSYEQAFAKIKETTGIEDTRQLVDKFIELEDQNFSLFNFVNELNTEIESIQEQINEIANNIKRFNREGEAQDKTRKAAIQELEDKLKSVSQAASSFEQQHAQSSDKLGVLKQGVDQIFSSRVCEGAVLTDVLGTSNISEANVMTFLGAIEQRTNELLQLQALLAQKEKEKWEQQEAQLRDELEDDTDFDPTATLGPKPEPGSLLGEGPLAPVELPISIIAPSTTDGGDDDDEDRPLTPNELRMRTQKKAVLSA